MDATLEEVEVIADVPAATIGRLHGKFIALVRDPSRAGWRQVRKVLEENDLAGGHLYQMGWWADGTELWRIEPE